MSNQMFTQLPVVSSATMADIICAVQGNLSVQETLQQAFNLFLSNTILTYTGNPNGHLAGNIYQFCWDNTDGLLYICTTSGTSSSAVWTLASSNSSTLVYNEITTSSATMIARNGYVINFSGTCTLTLPTTAPFGTVINVIGKLGTWTIHQGAGQSIQIGAVSSTVGTGGSITATNQFNSVSLVCTTSDLTWTCLGAPQGNLTIV